MNEFLNINDLYQKGSKMQNEKTQEYKTYIEKTYRLWTQIFYRLICYIWSIDNLTLVNTKNNDNNTNLTNGEI